MSKLSALILFMGTIMIYFGLEMNLSVLLPGVRQEITVLDGLPHQPTSEKTDQLGQVILG